MVNREAQILVHCHDEVNLAIVIKNSLRHKHLAPSYESVLHCTRINCQIAHQHPKRVIGLRGTLEVATGQCILFTFEFFRISYLNHAQCARVVLQPCLLVIEEYVFVRFKLTGEEGPCRLIILCVLVLQFCTLIRGLVPRLQLHRRAEATRDQA